MRFILVAVLLLLVVLPDTDAFWGWRRLKTWAREKKEKVKNWFKNFKNGVKTGRDVGDLDADDDEEIDLQELRHVLGTRDADEFFRMIDLDDDDVVTVDEFKRNVVDEIDDN